MRRTSIMLKHKTPRIKLFNSIFSSVGYVLVFHSLNSNYSRGPMTIHIIMLGPNSEMPISWTNVYLWCHSSNKPSSPKIYFKYFDVVDIISLDLIYDDPRIANSKKNSHFRLRSSNCTRINRKTTLSIILVLSSLGFIISFYPVI